MIELEILKSPDSEVIGPVLICKDTICIGKSLRSDIVINDEELSPLHFVVSIVDESLVCHGTDESIFYISNSKKVAGKKAHKINDTFKIGNSEIKIISFKKDQKKKYRELMQTAYQKISEDNPDVDKILSLLRKEILLVEKTMNSSMPEK